MDNAPTTDSLLETIADVLWVCIVCWFILLVVWGLALMCAGDFVYRLQHWFVPITQDQFRVIFYGTLAFAKVCFLGFFLFPWLAIKLVLRRRRR